jgi:ribosomal protein L40E
MHMICRNCGYNLPDEARFCKKCGTEVIRERQDEALENQQPQADIPEPAPAPEPEPVSVAAQVLVQPPKQNVYVPHNHKPLSHIEEEIALSNGEVVVRSYHCASQNSFMSRFFCEEGDGHVIVTNKRIVYKATGRINRKVCEVPIEAYQGFLSFYGHCWHVWRVIAGAILAAIALTSMYGRTRYGVDTASVVFLAIGALLIITARTHNMAIMIYSAGNSAPITIEHMSGMERITGQGALNDGGYPTSQTDKMMFELGAVIADIKALGDAAVEKWRR